MNNWGNDLISTPAASRQGTAQTTPRPSAPPSALRNKSNKQQVLPAVAAALKKDKAKEAEIKAEVAKGGKKSEPAAEEGDADNAEKPAAKKE